LLILLVLVRAAVNIVKIGIIEQLINLGVNLADVPCQEVVLVDLLCQGPQELRLRAHQRVLRGEGGSLELLLLLLLLLLNRWGLGCWVRLSGAK
jgi:hypothetical protein